MASGPEGMEAVYKREPGLKTTLEQIEKQFGEGSIMPLGGEALLKISGVTTGSLVARHGVGRSGGAARADHRNLRAGIER